MDNRGPSSAEAKLAKQNHMPMPNNRQDFIEYAKTHPFPTLKIDKPISQQEFDKKKAEFDKQVEQYQKDMEAQSKAHTDDVTDPPAATTPAASK